MNVEERYHVCRGMVMALALAIYNGEDWDKQAVAAHLHMGDEAIYYTFRDDPPEKLTDRDVASALDAIFERKGI